MAGSFEVSGANIIVHFEYEALAAKIQSTLGDAAEYLFDKGFGDHGTEEVPIVFGDLSNQDKLDLVDIHIRSVVLALADTFKSVKAQDAARAAEEASKHEF